MDCAKDVEQRTKKIERPTARILRGLEHICRSRPDLHHESVVSDLLSDGRQPKQVASGETSIQAIEKDGVLAAMPPQMFLEKSLARSHLHSIRESTQGIYGIYRQVRQALDCLS
jgi:hypothetical protein